MPRHAPDRSWTALWFPQSRIYSRLPCRFSQDSRPARACNASPWQSAFSALFPCHPEFTSSRQVEGVVSIAVTLCFSMTRHKAAESRAEASGAMTVRAPTVSGSQNSIISRPREKGLWHRIAVIWDHPRFALHGEKAIHDGTVGDFDALPSAMGAMLVNNASQTVGIE